MWTAKTADFLWEPMELRELKEKLAKLSCKCLHGNTKTVISTPSFVNDQNNKEVQVEQLKIVSLDRFTQINPETLQKERKDLMNSLTKDVLCPSCFVTMTLLRGAALKILKDEESETKSEMFSCDKCVGKCVRAAEKTTSMTCKPVIKYSNLTLCDFISEYSSDMSVPMNDQKRSHHQVKFMDVPIHTQHGDIPMKGACFCLENFMNSIRPPMNP